MDFSGLMRRINLNFWQTLVNGFITLKLICWRTTQVRGGLVKSAGLNRTLTDSSGRFKSGRNWWSPPYGEILARLIALGAKLSPVIAKLSLFGTELSPSGSILSSLVPYCNIWCGKFSELGRNESH